eukprot:GHVU01062590.1.p1 GENE.GHVU01062590.1~~GHVU01062590.1.p1  ORF type:complete len:106 (-),score=6.46 GHVU01062590.1:90-407(-)
MHIQHCIDSINTSPIDAYVYKIDLSPICERDMPVTLLAMVIAAISMSVTDDSTHGRKGIRAKIPAQHRLSKPAHRNRKSAKIEIARSMQNHGVVTQEHQPQESQS